MNLKLISLVGFATLAAASQAQIALSQVTAPSGAGSAFGSSTFSTSYSGATGNVVVNKTAGGVPGAVSGWIYTATDSTVNGYITTFTVKDVFTGTVTANSKVSFLVTADEKAAATFAGPSFTSGGYVAITSQPGWNAATDTLTETFDLSSYKLDLFKISINQDFKNVTVAGTGTGVNGAVPEPASFAVFGFGAIGLLIRRRKNS
jgi:hypothetical protein